LLVVFRRRNKLGWWEWFRQAVYPKGGWARAVSYLGHRLKRINDSPQKIARGVGAGVFVCFTPFFGFHFFLAALVCVFIRGNIIASITATFFGNPITFPLIATGSLKLGTYLLGRESANGPMSEVSDAFLNATAEIWANIRAIFTSDTANWISLGGFFDAVFFPYLIGGLAPGVVLGVFFYTISLPVIQAYRNRRKGRLKAKLLELRERAAKINEDKSDDT
jgi:uncharacterized protein (DUF2062 family)